MILNNLFKQNTEKIFILFIIVFLFFGILLIAAQNEGPGTTNPTGNTAGGANAGTGTQEKITAGENEVKKVGDKVGELKPDAVTIQGGTLTPGTENSKFNFETKNSELISSGNKVKNVETQTSETKAEVKLNKKGGIDEADIKSGKEGTNIQTGGKKSNLEFNAPEGSRVIKNKDNNIFQVELKEGSQIKQEPVKKQKKEGESEEEDKTVQYNSRTGFTKLPDDVAKSLGFKSMEFKGILSHNGDNWFVGSKHDLTLKINSKESMQIQNIHGGKTKELNEVMNLFFGEKGFDKSKIEGAFLVLGKDNIRAGSTNNIDGHPFKLLEGNPYLNIGEKGHLAMVSLKNSEFLLKGGENPQISIKGSAIVDNDNTAYLLSEQKGKLIFKEGLGIDAFGKNFKDSAGIKMDILPFKSDGSGFSDKNLKVLIGLNKKETGSDFKMVPMSASETEIGRLMFNQPPADSENRPVAPLVPVESPTPSPPPALNPAPIPPTPPLPQPSKPDPVGWKFTSDFVKNIASSPDPMFKGVGKPYNPKEHKILALDFSASWCGPCKMLMPTLHQLGSQRGDVKVVPIDSDTNRALATKYGISGFPTVIFVDTETGKEFQRFSGVRSLEDIMGMINQKGR